jgi:hypothetical protein
MYKVVKFYFPVGKYTIGRLLSRSTGHAYGAARGRAVACPRV